MLTTFSQCNFSLKYSVKIIYAIIDWVYPGLPKWCIVGYSLTCPIAMLNIYALIFRLRSLRNFNSLKLYASINICIILHVPPVKSSSTFPILHPTVLLRRKFIHACSGIKVTISYNSQKMGYPSIKCACDWLRICIIIPYSQYMYFQLLINHIIPLTNWVGTKQTMFNNNFTQTKTKALIALTVKSLSSIVYSLHHRLNNNNFLLLLSLWSLQTIYYK